MQGGAPRSPAGSLDIRNAPSGGRGTHMYLWEEGVGGFSLNPLKSGLQAARGQVRTEVVGEVPLRDVVGLGCHF